LKPIVVGVDLGITSAIAILDIEGNVLCVKSRRNWKREEIVKEILKIGKPLLVATDVSPNPKGIEEIAREIGCLVFRPKKSLGVEEKRELVRGYEIVSNSHEIDALSAAIKAYNKYKELFRRASLLAKEYKLENFLLEVLMGVLRKDISNLREGFKKFKEIKEIFEPRYEKLENEVKEYKRQISRLNELLSEKESEIRRLKEEVNFLVRRVRSLKKDKFRLLRKIKYLKRRARGYENR